MGRTETRAEIAAVVYAALAPEADMIPDEDPEVTIDRAWRNADRYPHGVCAGLAEEAGISWPARPELLAMAEWAGRARWATLRRDRAIADATAAGCPLRAAAALTGLSHQTIANIAGRAPRRDNCGTAGTTR